jgi:hypothetical protein
MDETKEREAFIGWALESRLDVTTSWGDIFADPMTQYAWEGWRARAAARYAPQEADDGK